MAAVDVYPTRRMARLTYAPRDGKAKALLINVVVHSEHEPSKLLFLKKKLAKVAVVVKTDSLPLDEIDVAVHPSTAAILIPLSSSF